MSSNSSEMYFLNIFKPVGVSSFDIIRDLRKILNERSIGHSGTLDPLAQGVMQVAVGRATRLLDYLDGDKTYIAEIVFGYVTETYDSEKEPQFVKTPDFSYDELIKVINSFMGETCQIPPKYSAIKQNGQKLCDIMHKNPNAEIKLPKRKIFIYSIELLESKSDWAKIKVHCKKGTYIRSLVHDIGQILGCGAYMKSLTRIKAGSFDIEHSQKVDDELIKINPLEVLNYERYELNDFEYEKVKNGNSIAAVSKFKGDYILLTKNNKLVSIALKCDNVLKPKKTFA